MPASSPRRSSPGGATPPAGNRWGPRTASSSVSSLALTDVCIILGQFDAAGCEGPACRPGVLAAVL
eukprot:9952136-Heterocapsa_arctica.AAC.1